MAVTADVFAYYKSGTIDPGSKHCAPKINHTVVLVGYESEASGAGSGPGEVCRKRTSQDSNYSSGCIYNDEWKKNVKFCCREEEEGDYSGGVWKLQNSYGKTWGDQGYFYVRALEGAGTCQMNKDIFWVEPQLPLPDFDYY
jgi:C1A family cysteine protease